MDKSAGRAFDTWLGSGSLIFGHGDGVQHSAAVDMLPEGAAIDESLFTNLEAAAGWAVGGAGFQTSGSSAIARACRLARAATGREKVAVVKSFWHGSDDQFLFAGANKEQISTGVPQGSQSSSHWFESIDQFLATAHLPDYAAILLEPYQGADPSATTLSATHSAWREVLEENNILLIVDEIITGFRERYGACTASRESKPDILVFGKAVGNGYPVGVVLVTPRVADLVPKTFFWGGTFAASPTQMSAITGHVKRLLKLDYAIMQKNLVGICARVEKMISAHKFNLVVTKGCGFARIKELSEAAMPRAFFAGNQSDFQALRDVGLREGIYLGANGLIFSSVYNIEDNLS